MAIPKLKTVIDSFVVKKRPFTILEVKEALEKTYEEEGTYYDAIRQKELKIEILNLFEKGEFTGYVLKTFPMIDENGIYFVQEYSYDNQMYPLKLFSVAKKSPKVTCSIDPYYKDMVKLIAKSSGCSQDMIVRSILTRGLDLLADAFK